MLLEDKLSASTGFEKSFLNHYNLTSHGLTSTFTQRSQMGCCRLPHTNHTQPAGGFIRTDRTQPAYNLPRVK